MDPITLAFIGMGGFQIISGLQQADMIRAQAGLMNEIAQFNAEGAELDAFNAMADGQTQVARYQSVIDEIEANQRVAFITNDVDTNFGTAADILEESKLNAFLNKVDLSNNAFAKSQGYEREARNIRLNAVMGMGQANLSANATRNAAIINGITTGVSGYAKYNSGGGGFNPSQTSTPIRTSQSSYLTGTSQGDATGYLGNYNF